MPRTRTSDTNGPRAAVPGPAAPRDQAVPGDRVAPDRSGQDRVSRDGVPRNRTERVRAPRDRNARDRDAGNRAARSRMRLPEAGRQRQSDGAGTACGKAAGPTRRSAGPRRRLTAVGAGVVAATVTLLGALADNLLLGGLGVLFGLVYVALCFQLAVRVRSADLLAAPVSGPIAFALALLLLGPTPGRGFAGHLMGLTGGLATRAGWLFAGTGLAAVIALARYVAMRRAHTC